MEHKVQEAHPGGCVPLSERRHVDLLCQVSPEFDFGWNLLRSDRTVGQSSTEANTHSEDPSEH